MVKHFVHDLTIDHTAKIFFNSQLAGIKHKIIMNKVHESVLKGNAYKDLPSLGERKC